MPSDADPANYSERLWASPGIWAATIGFGAALGLILVPVDLTAAVIFGALGVVGFVTLLVLTTPSLTLADGYLTAGRARMPVSVVASVEALDAGQMRQARGTGLDARAYLCIRGWLPVGARVVLADPEDPTPYWLVSSRRPAAFAAAVSSWIDQSPRQSQLPPQGQLPRQG